MSDTPPHELGLDGHTLHDLGLAIEGTPLEPILAAFDREREAAGFGSLVPEYYLATEWGVPFPSLSLAIPFYLARPDLTELHGKRTGLIEGATRADISRYLRHEFGHVVNYAYQLYEREEWTHQFGPFTRPYPEEYRPKPFSTEYVRHLPGWYAQKHPDEDWAETFAVWMDPARDWRTDYAGWPVALAKLEYCDAVCREVAGTPPLPFPTFPEVETSDDEEWDEFAVSLAEFYGDDAELHELPGLDGALRATFDDGGGRPAGDLVRRLSQEIGTNVFRWTGHFPERTLPLLRLIARRADELGQTYDPAREGAAVVALTALVTSLAMNHVHHGDYLPGGPTSTAAPPPDRRSD